MTTEFTFWGHNCFLLESGDEALLIDPWLNDSGAFFGSWHQWPPNGHLRSQVLARCLPKALAIFLSHEHQDHFDTETLRAFCAHPRCTVFIPRYKDKFLLGALTAMGLATVELAEGDEAGARIRFRIFIDDGGINHDSAIFVATPELTFFNQNDCKVFDRLARLKDLFGRVDYYSVQFSGANWHPACFEMPAEQKRQVARKKVAGKLRNVLNANHIMAPRFFVPAAGPAFFPFLDAGLNDGSGSIFIHQAELDAYLRAHLRAPLRAQGQPEAVPAILYPRPGEALGADCSRTPIAGPTPAEIERYRATHRDVWQSLPDSFDPQRLADVLARRLAAMGGLELPPDTPSIAFCWGPAENDTLVVDLACGRIERSRRPCSPGAPAIVLTASARYFALMCGEARWQDIALSLRAGVQRTPDRYSTIANIFLFADESSLRQSLLENLNLSKERIVVVHRGQHYQINRYCPHQGGDLAYAAIDDDLHLVCPRHSWRFDLACAGLCKASGMSIAALKVDPPG